ncbi:MAG: hypothetical protein JJT76_15280 [Clostridiaceae bacterium]|nr:hypothetical protein [Clostridiaceae bacterium]
MKNEVYFTKELNAKNKLVRFIIDKIIEESFKEEKAVDIYGITRGEKPNSRDYK